MHERRIRFGRFELRPATRELIDGAQPLRIGERASTASARQIAAWRAEGERWNDDDAAEALLS